MAGPSQMYYINTFSYYIVIVLHFPIAAAIFVDYSNVYSTKIYLQICHSLVKLCIRIIVNIKMCNIARFIAKNK